jgi:nucleolar protein 56
MVLFLLHETAYGYALFERQECDEVAQFTPEMQEAFADISRFSKMVKVRAFTPFKSAAHALENINDVSEGVLSEHLKTFLTENLPASSKKKVLQLGVMDKSLAGSIKEELAVECVSDDLVFELLRGVRAHAEKLLKGLNAGDLEKAQLGLAHSYSRAKVKFNVHRSDNMIIQAIALLDQSDKDINTFAMRVREWYSWHFPELSKLVTDNYSYARLVLAIKDKSKLNGEEDIIRLTSELRDCAAVIGNTAPLNEDLPRMIVEASRASMGSDISDIDLLTVSNFARQLVSMFEQRLRLAEYLSGKMSIVAPNLATLIGNTIGARLIAHAGSLTNLAKYPASTVQILGAEKALFRALKTRSKTPKYGLIYHASAIGKTEAKNKGRISRYLANKCSIASRIDCFSDSPSTVFGEALKSQVDNRVAFYAHGEKPLRNAEVMDAVVKSIKKTVSTESSEKKSKKRSSKDAADEDEDMEKSSSSKKDKKDKKEKKEKKSKKD